MRTKLGVPFLAACGDDATDPPWLAAAPIECGMGDHATVACPTVLPLVARPCLPALMLPRTAVLTDAVTAHRVCRLRAPVAPDGSEPATLVPIACERAPIELHPSDADALAAFRCMLPSAALPPPIAPPLSP
ncbi:MAG: hypothetical protein U1F43_09435 [Myxococcota bacterium]